jgi:soluble cytochrome b562
VTVLRSISLFSFALAALFLVLPSAPAGAARQDEATEDDTPLLKDMEVIQDQLKFLRRNLKKPEENPASLAAIQEMQRAAVACKAMDFPMAEAAEGEAREKLLTGYKLEMIGLIESLLQMERALLAGDNDKARELYKTVKAFEDSGHEKFLEEE